MGVWVWVWVWVWVCARACVCVYVCVGLIPIGLEPQPQRARSLLRHTGRAPVLAWVKADVYAPKTVGVCVLCARVWVCVCVVSEGVGGEGKKQ